MADNNSKIFREKSLEKISSPDELDKYIKIAPPSVIILFVAVILLTIGYASWAIFGTVETASNIGCVLEENTTTTYITEDDYNKYVKGVSSEYIQSSMYMEFDDFTVSITNISIEPVLASENSDAFLLRTAEISVGDWYYVVSGQTTEGIDGKYSGRIIYYVVSPISFLFNA